MREIKEKEIREIKQELETIKSVAMIKWPFFASLLRKCRIIIDPNIEAAGVNAQNEMIINPGFLRNLDDKAKVFLYGHEISHIAFRHSQREGDRTHRVFNRACDSVINYLLFAHGFEDVKFPFDLVTPEKVAALVKKRVEEITPLEAEAQYALLKQHCKEPPFNIMDDLNRGNKQPEQKDKSKVIQEGDPDAYKDDLTPEEKEKYWKEALIQAVLQAKMAGRLPADAERIIKDLLQAKINWASIIKKEILDGLGKNIISTWKRTSRKHGLLPGTKHLTRPVVWLLPDTSASTFEILPQFFGEIYCILKNQGKGVIIPWDAKDYPPIQLEKSTDLGQIIKENKIRGGGGTVIFPVLETVHKSMKHGDIVVILTDGYILDIKEETIQKLLQDITQKSSQAIFGSVDINIPVPAKWKKVKIEI